MSKTKAEVNAILAPLGLDLDDVANAVGLAPAAAKVRQTATIQVVVNEGEAKKFGDVSIVKVQANGYKQPKVGIFAADLPGFIEALVEADAVVNA